MLVELPIVTIDPPDSTNFFRLGMVLSSVIRPTHARYSDGTFAGSGLTNPPRPPPRPVAPPRRIAPSAKTITSNFARRSLASRVLGQTRSNGISYCSNSHRVQPDGILPP